MNRRDLLLAALSPSKGAAYTPVQVQKLLFLLDREAAHLLAGPHFEFEPYDYGPFDKHVYRELETLSEDGYVAIERAGTTRTFRLTPEGQAAGDDVLARLGGDARKYMQRTSEFVRSLSFQDLVTAIYKAYPEMRARSVFRG